ncbi:unnamed protein product [Chondrus crispus]|uniref:VOC domain-containing protein n=1 Tax=Chondrus crispus TaxID=2769 RepID=R7Q8C6_CHOCR|nr:unnamed protein product [Chondrus crispus]CDF34038.1 unnamed protein product [Chondrus crispus]|eukprot:XP_005713857.1 unnamed protein product [Chondrus crispus]
MFTHFQHYKYMAFIVPALRLGVITHQPTTFLHNLPNNRCFSTRSVKTLYSACQSRPTISFSLASQESITSQPSAMSYMNADLDHIALDCKSDPLDLLDFYVSVFNFEPLKVEEFKAGTFPFPSVRTSAKTILDFFATSKDDPNPPKGLRQSNHFCFAVSKSDWDELRVRLKEKKVDTMGEPKERSGARGDGVSIYVKDPEENVVEFRYYPHEA